ncbi:MAG: hypothetical protein WCK59_02515 [Candidatus Falkowbacteria bacterium]
MKINTILLITLDQSGQVMAQIQSGVVPFPRIIKVSSPQALESAWNDEQNGEIFYDSVRSSYINKELADKMKELGIKDGTQVRVKKYRLGNQPQEYELREDYLDYLPVSFESWEDFASCRPKNVAFSIFSPNGIIKSLFFHRFIIKDAFPLSFFGEERSENWNRFAVVSETETSAKFIIPLV